MEFLPVTISFIAAKGCVSALVDISSYNPKLTMALDLMLFDLFAALQEAGIIQRVVTGSRMFI